MSEEKNTEITSEQILLQVKDVVCEELEVDAEQVSMGASIVEDLGADSLDVVELIMRLEEKFEVEIPDDEAEKIQTIGHAVNFIVAKLS